MENVFITELKIEKVRHLQDITISLDEGAPKHLILTGKNGSGKTSLLEAMARYLNEITVNKQQEHQNDFFVDYQINIEDATALIEYDKARNAKRINRLASLANGISIQFNKSLEYIEEHFNNGTFLMAYYKADRIFHADVPENVEKVALKTYYKINESPRQEFLKYLLNLKVTEALVRNNGNVQRADEIQGWFENFEELLRKVFEDNSLRLIFEEESFRFSIQTDAREVFDFNTLSSGFAAILDIVLDMMMRMQTEGKRTFDFQMPGVVLIDEIETHLHLEMQKKVLKLLTTLFPNVQFVVSTHSPFILNSLENVVIYDLENRIQIHHGLEDVPYDGIVEGYFQTDNMSDMLKEKFETYRQLTQKEELTDDDFAEIAELEMYLNEIPDYLALNITTEYQRLKEQFESRGDI